MNGVLNSVCRPIQSSGSQPVLARRPKVARQASKSGSTSQRINESMKVYIQKLTISQDIMKYNNYYLQHVYGK